MNSSNQFISDANDMIASFEQNQKKWQEYYSQPLYSPPVQQNGGQIYNTDQLTSGQSPQPLVPHGSAVTQSQKGNVTLNPYMPPVNIYNQQPAQQVYNTTPQETVGNTTPQAEMQYLTEEQLFGTANPSTEPNSSLEWSDEGDGNQAINDPEGLGISELANKYGAGIAQYATSAYASLKGVDGSEKESWGKALQLGTQGAKLGNQIGGPLGAAIGGGVGTIAGVVNVFSDQNKRNKMERKKNAEKALRAIQDRERDYEIRNAEKQIETLTSMSKSQLNYIK